MATTVDVFFSATNGSSRYKLTNAWVYWRESGIVRTLRADSRGLVSAYGSGPDTLAASYTTPFIAQTDTTVELAYCLGVKPAPSPGLAFTQQKVTVSLGAELAQLGPRRADTRGRTTSLRVLPVAELRIPEITPLPVAVGLITVNLPLPAPGAVGPAVLVPLMHVFGTQSYEADRQPEAGFAGEHRTHSVIPATATRVDLETATQQLAEQLAWRGSPTRRVVWSVGHGLAGDNHNDAAFDMAPNVNGVDNRIRATDLDSVIRVMGLRQNNPAALQTATIPQKVLELEREFEVLRRNLAENGVTQLVVYACRVASSAQGQQMLRNLSTLLSTTNNHVAVGGYTSWVVARIPAGATQVEVGLAQAHADEHHPANWQQRSTHSLPTPEFWTP
jgi:hypothetical protein